MKCTWCKRKDREAFGKHKWCITCRAMGQRFYTRYGRWPTSYTEMVQGGSKKKDPNYIPKEVIEKNE